MSRAALKVAVFRAPEEGEATQVLLAARGFVAVLAPVTEIVGLAVTAPAGPFDFAVATSAKAFAFGAGSALGGLPLYVVGDKTAQAAARAGFVPAPAADDVKSLLARLPAGRALYLAGRDRTPDLEAALEGRIEVMEAYAAQARTGWRADEAGRVAGAAAALHYSTRGAALATAFAERAGVGPSFLQLSHVCISRAAAAPLAAAARVMWPLKPTESALLDVLESARADRR